MEQETKNFEAIVVQKQQSREVTENDVKVLLGEKAKYVDALTIRRFVELCRFRNLNPFLNEAYLIPFKRADGSYTYNIVVSKYVFLRRALQHPDCDGFASGVIVQTASGELVERDGSMVLDSEKLVGGWAVSRRKSFSVAYKKTVALSEYVKNTDSWARMKSTMLEKVALVQALRDHYPEELGNMYTEEELKDNNNANVYVTTAAVTEQDTKKVDAVVVKQQEQQQEQKQQQEQQQQQQQQQMQEFPTEEHEKVYNLVKMLVDSGDIKATAVANILKNKYNVQKIANLKIRQLGDFLTDVESLVVKAAKAAKAASSKNSNSK